MPLNTLKGTNMNRREMLKVAASSLAALLLPNFTVAATKKPEWFTHDELMVIFNHVYGKTSHEYINLDNPVNWKGMQLDLHEAYYLAVIRMSNIMHRKTLDNVSKHWMVVSPSFCERPIWYGHQFGVYSTPGKPGGVWIKKHWREVSKEVAPGVYSIGNMNCKWSLYLDEKFPANVALLGMGYRQVVRHEYTGKKNAEGYPEIKARLGKPTVKNYAYVEHRATRLPKLIS